VKWFVWLTQGLPGTPQPAAPPPRAAVMQSLLKQVSIAFAIVWGGLALTAVWAFVLLWLVGVIVV